MSRPPLFMETLAARGLAEETRPLGAVGVGLPLIDAPQPRLIDGLTRMLAAAERDAEAATVMTSLRGLFDPMTGRPAGGGW